MTRYRLITPHGVYAPGTILDTDLPAGQMFSLEGPAARRLTELGVLEPLIEEEPQGPRDDPGWREDTVQGAAQNSPPAAPCGARPAGGRATASGTGRPKEQSTR